MNLYTIRRRNAWSSPEEVEAIAQRAKEVADSDFPTEVRWIRSYVLADQDGTLGSLCVYQAVNAEAILQHSHRVGMPADEITAVLETVIVRPDPALASTTP
jgi:sporulation protein YlmC with PRC-barrel domain